VPVASELLVKIGADTAQAEQGIARVDKQIGTFAKGAGALGGVATAAFAGIGLAAIGLGAGLGSAVSTAADFEHQIAGVGSLVNATSDQIRQLSDAALQLGQDTTLSGIGASDAAKAMAELAAAGFSVDDMTGGVTRGVLLLASATGTAVPQAAQIAGDAFNEFRKSMGLTAADMPRIANLFVGAANVSSIGLGDIGESMKYIGPLAASMGISIDDVTAAIAELGNQGIKGSEAGTALRTMLVSVTSPSKEAAKTIADLGLNFVDASGHVKDFGGIAEELKVKLAGLTDAQRAAALSTLFGREAVAAATVLYGEGAAGIQGYIDQINAQGDAAAQGAARNNNLAGSFQSLQGVIETLKIKIGQQLTPVLKVWVDWAARVLLAALPLVDAWGPRFIGAIQSGIGRGVAIVRSFGLAVMAMVNSLRTGDFSNLFGPLITAVSTAFGSDTAGKVTLFVSKFVTGLNLARDAVLTAKQAFAGDWVSADTIATPVRLVGDLFLILGNAVRTVQGWIARIPAPVLAAAGAFLALGPALSIVGAILPTLVGALTGLGPIISFLGATIPLLGTVIGALGGPITVAIVAIGLLAAAWATNFMGIRDTTMPVVNEIVAFFSGTLLPALTTLGTFVSTTVVPAFVAGWAAVQLAVSTAIAAIMPLVQQFSDWFTVNLLPALQNLAAVAIPAFQQMASAAQGAFQAALPGIQTFIAGVQQLASVVTPILAAVGQVIIDSLGPAVMAMVGWAQTVIPQFAAAFTNVMSIVGPIVGELASLIGTGLSTIAGFISDHSAQITAILTDAWNIISGVIGVVFSVITGVISAGLQAISGDWEGAWATIQATASTVWAGIQDIVTNAIDLVKNVITVGLAAAQDVATVAWEAIKTAATTAWEGIKTTVSTAIDGVKTLISDGLNAAKDTAQTALGGMATAATTAMGNLKTAISNGISSAKDTISSGVSGFADIVLGVGDALYNAGASIIGRLASGIDSAIGAAVQKVKDGLSQIANLLPHSEPRDPSSPLRGLGDAGKAIFSMLAEGIGQGAPQAIKATQDAAGAISRSLSNTLGNLGTITETGADKSAAGIMRRFAADFDVALDTMKAVAGAAGDFLMQANAYKDLILMAVTAIKTAQAALNTVNVGSGGLTIPALRGAGDQAGQALGNGVVQGVRRALDSHSPSQVMAAIGADITAGLALGMTQTQQAAAKAASDVASAVAKAVQDTLAAATALGSLDIATLPTGGQVSGILTFTKQLIAGVQEAASGLATEAVAAAVTWADGAGKVAAFFGSGSESLAKLAGYVQVGQGAIENFGADLRVAVNDLIFLTGEIATDLVTAAAAWSEQAAKGVAIFGSSVQGFEALRGYVQIGADAIYAFDKDLMLAVADLAAIVDLVGQEVADKAGALGEQVGKATGGIAAAVAGFAALRGYARIGTDALYAFGKDMMLLIADFAAIVDLVGIDMAQKAGTLGEAVGKIVGSVANAVTGLGAIRGFLRLPAADLAAFADSLGDLVKQMVAVAARFEGQGLDAATSLGEAVGKITGGIGSAVSGLKDLLTFVSPPASALDAFAASVQAMIARMVTIAGTLATDGVAAASTLGDSLSKVFAGLNAGTSFFKSLDNLLLPDQAGIDRILAPMLAVVRTLADAARTLDPATLASATGIGTAFSSIFAGIQAGNQALAPVAAGGGGGGGATYIYTFNISGPVYGFDQFEDEVVSALEDARRRGRID
jgi:TP901 family phage tail tape measure protein